MNERSTANTLMGVGLISCGLLFFLGQVFSFSVWGVVWPMFFLVPGLAMLFFAVNGPDEAGWLALPGANLAGTGVIFLYQSVTGHWESWAYVWTLYGVFTGVGLMHAARRNNIHELYPIGNLVAMGSGIACLFMGAFFELLIFEGGLRRIALAVLMIGLGVWMMSRDREQNSSDYKAKRNFV